MNCIKRQKDMTPKEKSSRSEGVQYATGERTTTISPRKNEKAGPKQKQCSIVDVSRMKVKSDAVKNSIA